MRAPTREEVLAVEEAQRKRREALRTRDGVVDLAEWRAATTALRWMEAQFARLPELLSIRLAPAEDVGFVLQFTLLRDDPMTRRCLPSAVNDVPVRVQVRNPGAGDRGARPEGAPTRPPPPAAG